MFSFPSFRRIKSTKELQEFSNQYCKASGLPIPEKYLNNLDTNVFGIYFRKKLIGGFILGNSTNFRTIEFFASEKNHSEIHQNLGDLDAYTEICCFYIDKNFRAKPKFNFFIWLAMTYALKRFGRRNFLFGTCSRNLSLLYSKTSKSIPIHQDRVNGKVTFIFKGKRSNCIFGMLEIIVFKLKRTFKLRGRTRKVEMR